LKQETKVRPVDGISRSSGVGLGFQRRSSISDEPAGERSTSRAVITLQPVSRTETTTTPARRVDVGFLAHLIATQQGFPQTRERRRREPDDVVAVYDKTLLDPVAAGRVLALTR
jgi:hypothetical protein